MANTLEETPKPATKPREGRAPKLAAQRDADATSPEDGIVRAGPDDDASTERVSSLASAPAIRTTPARRGVVRRSLPWVLVALATAAAVVFALLWRNADSARSASEALEHQRAEVVATGTQFLTALTNFSGDTIDRDVQRIRGYAVGDFAQQVQQFFGPTNVDALQKAKVVSIGRVRSVFVQSIDGPQASVFGVVDEAIRNAHSAPRTMTLRIDVEMLETSSGWKVSTVDILEAPGSGPLG